MSKKRFKAAGVLFLAASSVYALGALAETPRSEQTPVGAANLTINPLPELPQTLPQLNESVAAAPTIVAAPAFRTPVVEQIVAAPAAATNVKVLEADDDPFANPPSSQPSDKEPSNEGESVTADNVTVSDEGTVEIHVNDAVLVEVLRMLSIQSQRNIVASKEVGGKVTANLYGVTVREALDAILHANGYAYREKGNFIYVYTAKEIAEMEKAERVTTTEMFRLFYTPASNAANMIKPVLSDAAQVSLNQPAESGIETGTGETGGDGYATGDILVVTDYSENLERVRKVLKELDRRPQQILIEATILRAALSEDNALGVDFNVTGGVDFTSILSNLGGQITGANQGGNFTKPDGSVSTVGSGNNFTSSVPNGFKVGVVTDSISVFLAALEGVTDTTVLANPKVLALNKQKGEVIVGRKDGYLTTTVTESSTVQTVEFLDTGTRLIFRPYIGDDGYVRMEIHPEDSSGGLTADNLPFKITTEVTSNIMVKDGHTVVIGGLFRESSDSSRNQVPGLGNIPLAGMLFKNQRDRTVREEIIILLTPHIIKDDEAFSAASETELKELDKLRVGVRRGMMPWGRERLAEFYFDRAVEELNKPAADRNRAMFFLEAATNLNPKFREAIMLKEEQNGRILTTSDNSSIRSFLKRQILADRERPAPATLPSSVPISVTPRNAPPTHQSVPAVLPTRHEPATQPSTTTIVKVDETASAEGGSSSPLNGTNSGSDSATPAVDWKTWLNSATAAAKPVSNEEPATRPSTQPTLVEIPMTELPATVTELPAEPVPSNDEPELVEPMADPAPSVEPTAAPSTGGNSPN